MSIAKIVDVSCLVHDAAPIVRGGVMKKIFVATSVALFSAGCAVNPADPTAALSGTTGFLSFINNTAALDQALAEDIVKVSAQLEYLSLGKATCNDNPEVVVRDYGQARNVARDAIIELGKYFTELKFLKEYSEELTKIATEYTSSQTDIENLRASAVALGALTPEGIAAAAAVNGLASAIKAANTFGMNAKLRATAEGYHPQLQKTVKALKDKVPAVNTRSLNNIAIWRRCVEEKYE